MKVKTFKEACQQVGINPAIWLIRLHEYSIDRNTIAYLKLKIICKVLNGLWEPDYVADEQRFYPQFRVSRTNDNEKVLVYSTTYSSNIMVPTSSKLCLKTPELARYCGKQFIDIWNEFLM